MFSAKLRRLCGISNKVFVRTIRGGRISSTGPNPGLSKRIDAFRKERIPITDDDAEEFVEQSDSDFYKIGEVYNEHMNETLIGKYELRHQIVKEKYFKINLPNLLTWSEKEQIRHLATTEPEEWTPERIAESFPVTVPVVKKLLKYAWKPASVQRIERHDASAMRNWRELKEGSLDIPPKLREHFLKFSERTIPPLKKESIKIDLTQQIKMGEFESIVKKCADKDNKEYVKDTHENISKHSTDTVETKNKVRVDTKRMTLDQLTDKINRRLEKGKEVNMPDKIIANLVKTESKEVVPENDYSDLINEIDLASNKEAKGLEQYKDNDINKQKDVMEYPERIRIPKKAYKKGATYKVDDCFYDHDGKFLYRVLGM